MKGQVSLDQVQEIELEKLRESPLNPRMDFVDPEFDRSVKDKGILAALIVRKSDKFFEILDGAKRYRAGKKAGLVKAPCIVKVVEDERIPEMMFEANKHASLKDVELGNSFDAMQNFGKMAVKDIAKRAGITESEVSLMMKLPQLPDSVKHLINQGFISRDIYKTLVKFIGYTEMMKWAEEKLAEMHKDKNSPNSYYNHKGKDDVVIEPLTRSDWSSALRDKLRKTQECTMIVNHLGENHFGPEWMKKFDAKACKGCKTIVDLDRDRVCLKTECWKPKARDAKRKVQEQKTLLKENPSSAVSGSELQKIPHEDLDDANFDVSVCNRCLDKKTVKQSWGGTSVVCTYPPCYNEMEPAAEKQTAAAIKQLNLEIEDAKKVFLDNYKPVGLSADVSMLILRETRTNPRKGAKPETLEKDAVRTLVSRNVRTLDDIPDEDDVERMKLLPMLKGIDPKTDKPKLTPTKRPKEEKKELAPGCDGKKKASKRAPKDEDEGAEE